MSTESLPREYRATAAVRGWQTAGVAVPMAVPVLGPWFVPAEEGFWWLRLLVTCLGLGVSGWLVRGIRRSGTTVGADGVRVRGLLGTRRLPWHGIVDIRAEEVPADDHGRGFVTVARCADGSRVTLRHLDGLQPVYRREFEFVRDVWARSRGPEATP